MVEKINQKQTKLLDLVPKEWFSIAETSSIWIQGYRVFRVSGENIIDAEVIDFSDVVAVIFSGSVNYLDSELGRIEYITETEWKFDASQVKERSTPVGVYLLLLIPYEIDGRELGEPFVRQRLQEVVALLMVINGRNAAFECIFNNIVSMESNRISGTTPTQENPLWFPEPNFSNENLTEISKIEQAIQQLPESQHNRVKLSLRWFESAMRTGGVESFLSYWIALETLGMEETNIRPLNEILAQIYNLADHKEANDKFGLGRIFSLRSRIVHKGQIIPLHQNLERYLEGFYGDIFFAKLGFPSQYRAKTILENTEFNLEAYL